MKSVVTLICIFSFQMVFGNISKIHDKLNTAADARYLSPIEKEIVYEINLFRSNPAKYAKDYIAPLAKYYKKKILYYPNDKPIQTKEGVRALNECIRVLGKQSPKPIMQPNKRLTLAANDHQRDQLKTGKTGHSGSDRSTFKSRIERYAKWEVQIAENIAYGNTSARQILIFLLIDDGVKKRGHRKTLLHPAYKTVGVSFGKHSGYRTMCVMDFAGGIVGE